MTNGLNISVTVFLTILREIKVEFHPQVLLENPHNQNDGGTFPLPPLHRTGNGAKYYFGNEVVEGFKKSI